nr:membrane protein [Raoultella sp. NCTC 9187]
MSMISGKLGEDKQNKQEKSETAIRESIGVVPLALPLMAGPGAISSTIVWGTRYHTVAHLFGFSVAIALVCLVLLGDFPHGTVARSPAWANRINVITRIMGLLLMALGIEFIVTRSEDAFSRVFWSDVPRCAGPEAPRLLYY